MNININSHVTVTLTALGVIHLRATEEQLRIPTKYQRTFDDRVLTLPLWELMQIFGPQMYHGNPQQMFVDNEIRLKPEPS